MHNSDTSFYPFTVMYNFFGFESYKIRNRNRRKIFTVLNYFFQLYMVVPIIIAFWALWIDSLSFSESYDKVNGNFILFVYNLDVLIYDIIICLLYVNLLQHRKFFKKVCNFFRIFDKIAECHDITLNHQNMRKYALVLILSTEIFVVAILIISFQNRESFLKFLRDLVISTVYFFYLFDLKFYIFIVWNIYHRLQEFQSKAKILTGFNCRIPQNYLVLIESIVDIMQAVNRGFWWNISLIFCN